MHRDLKKLAQITKLTFEKLGQEDVIMPSTYYETFINEAKELGNNELQTDDQPTNTTKMLKEVENKLFGKEDILLQSVEALKIELSQLRKQFFADNMTAAYNVSWLYQYKMSENRSFKDNGYVVDIKLGAYDAIIKDYGQNIAEKLITLLCDYLIEDLQKNHLEYDIVRFREDQFLLFIYSMNEDELSEYLEGLYHKILNHTFRFRNKIFSLSIIHSFMQYMKNEPFSIVLDQLEEQMLQKSLLGDGKRE